MPFAYINVIVKSSLLFFQSHVHLLALLLWEGLNARVAALVTTAKALTDYEMDCAD